MNMENVPKLAKEAVLVESSSLPFNTPIVQGYEWNNGIDYPKILQSYTNSGFQSTSFGLAVKEVNNMLDCRVKPLNAEQEDVHEEDPFIKRRTNCTLFLGYTSNMVSSGLRETIRFLVEHKMVDCIVTTAGGVEEDLIKCLAHTYIGDFNLDGRTLRDKGINRIGNLLVPNDNYCKFEDWVMPHLDAMLEEQKSQVQSRKTVWTPSKVIERLGNAIDNKSSICYWAAKNQIPIYSPALTDGSLGDMMYFHSYKNPGLILDILQDLRRLNSMAVKAINTGMIILGGAPSSLAPCWVLSASAFDVRTSSSNLDSVLHSSVGSTLSRLEDDVFKSEAKHGATEDGAKRNGADYAVFINTGAEFDGSDSGARPDEAISWGKIKKTAKPVKVYAEGSLVFPLLVGETFARRHFRKL